jgi:hypothetical protein
VFKTIRFGGVLEECSMKFGLALTYGVQVEIAFENEVRNYNFDLYSALKVNLVPYLAIQIGDKLSYIF